MPFTAMDGVFANSPWAAHRSLPQRLRVSGPTESSVHANTSCSIGLLHLGGLISGPLNLLERWEIIVVAQPLVIVIDAEAKLNHAVDTSSKLGWFIQVETRRKEGSIEEKPDQIFDSLVRLVGRRFFLQL